MKQKAPRYRNHNPSRGINLADHGIPIIVIGGLTILFLKIVGAI